MNKKLVQINTVCNGSTGKIMSAIADEAEKQGFKTYNFFGRGNEQKRGRDIKIENKLSIYLHVFISRLGFDGRGSYFSTKRLIKKIRRINPNVIHLHNIHGYYLNYKVLFKYLKNDYNGIIVWTLHDCWTFTGHCTHFTMSKCEKWKSECENCIQYKEYPKSFFDKSEIAFKLKKKLFSRLNNCTLVTPSKWLKDLVKQSFMKEYPIHVINNGIDLNIFKQYPKEELGEIYNKYNIPKNKKIILGVANVWSDSKGLYDFIEVSKLLNYDCLLVLVGIKDKDKKLIREKKGNIFNIGKTDNQIELAKIYQIADLFINLSRQETFGLTTVEAIACGIPIIAYNDTAIPEIIEDKDALVNIDTNRIINLKIKINKYINDKVINYSLNQARKFNQIDKAKDYINLYKNLCNTAK